MILERVQPSLRRTTNQSEPANRTHLGDAIGRDRMLLAIDDPHRDQDDPTPALLLLPGQKMLDVFPYVALTLYRRDSMI